MVEGTNLEAKYVIFLRFQQTSNRSRIVRKYIAVSSSKQNARRTQRTFYLLLESVRGLEQEQSAIHQFIENKNDSTGD